MSKSSVVILVLGNTKVKFIDAGIEFKIEINQQVYQITRAPYYSLKVYADING